MLLRSVLMNAKAVSGFSHHQSEENTEPTRIFPNICTENVMTVSARISTNKYFVPYKDCVNGLLREKADAETQDNAWDHEWPPGDQIIHATENIVCARDDISEIIKR